MKCITENKLIAGTTYRGTGMIKGTHRSCWAFQRLAILRSHSYLGSKGKREKNIALSQHSENWEQGGEAPWQELWSKKEQTTISRPWSMQWARKKNSLLSQLAASILLPLPPLAGCNQKPEGKGDRQCSPQNFGKNKHRTTATIRIMVGCTDRQQGY